MKDSNQHLLPAEGRGPVASRTAALVIRPEFTVNNAKPNGAAEGLYRLEEAVNLAQAIALDVREARTLSLRKREPATLLGKGQVAEIAELCTAYEVTLVIVDASLTPVQQRNLEKAWNVKVIDRTGLILDIFGERARTKEGQLQVELAALSYQKSRLVRSWTHLERQRGGFGFLGGPGESQIELDRRLIGERILQIKRELEKVKRTRALHRKTRKRVPYPVVALVGYTNAGKSTLFNRLTGAEVFAENLLFATLDPTMRRLPLDSDLTVILSDTVGFVSELPTQLVAAFRATLEEVAEADLILHVIDAANPEWRLQQQSVLDVLADLGLEPERAEGKGRVIELYNKADALPVEDKALLSETLARRAGSALLLSAATGEGLPELQSLMKESLSSKRSVVELDLPIAEGGEKLAWLYRNARILERHEDEETGLVRLKVSFDAESKERFERLLTPPA